MVDPTLPQRPWQGGERRMIIDRNGVARIVYSNPHQSQEDHQRYITGKQGEERKESGYSDVTGPTPQPSSVSSAMPPQPKAAKVDIPPQADWLIAIQQRYAADAPMRMALNVNAPVVTPEMLVLTDAQLAKLSHEERKSIARVFLSLASKYIGTKNLQQAYVSGSKVFNYLPRQIMDYYYRIVGIQGQEAEHEN